MDTLPNELILVIFDFLNCLPDMNNFTMTCKKYNKLTKEVMKNAKYPIFEISEDGDGYPVYDLICVCDTIELCYKCIKITLLKYSQNLDKYNAIDEDNYYILYGSRYITEIGYFERKKHGFIIERILINKLMK